MKSLVCQIYLLELNLLLYGQPMKLTKDLGDMFISSSIGYYLGKFRSDDPHF